MDCVFCEPKLGVQVVARKQQKFKVPELWAILVAIDYKVLWLINTKHASLRIVSNLIELIFHAMSRLRELLPVFFRA